MFVSVKTSQQLRNGFFAKPMSTYCLFMLMIFSLSACDQLGLDTPAKVEARAIEDSKAVGGACRNAMRAIEDCYTLNPKAKKAAVAAGWREMDEYMRENKLEGITPKLAKPNKNKTNTDENADEEVSAVASESAASDKSHAPDDKATLHAEAASSHPK